MKVLLAWDASSSNEYFLDRVGRHAWPAETIFHLLTVVEQVPDVALGLENQLKERAARQVEICVARLQSQGFKAEAVVRQGDPGDVIVHEADALGASLVVVGAPTSMRPLHLVTGSVARRVLRFAHCSVQISRPRPNEDRGLRVLVPVDGSEYSKDAVTSLTSRPWPDGTVFEVVSVVEPVSASMKYLIPGYTESAEAAQIRAATLQAAEDAIESAEGRLREAGLNVMDTVMVPVAPPDELILEEAARWQADLIVMGSHGRRGVTRFLLGSITEAVALHAACSVEVYRRAG